MRISAIVIMFLMIVSCGGDLNSNVVEPDNLLSREQMVKLLVDVQLIEAVSTRGLFNAQDSITGEVKGYTRVFRKYNITKVDFEQNLKYYYDFTDQSEELYGEVLSELIKMEVKLNNEEKKVTTD